MFLLLQLNAHSALESFLTESTLPAIPDGRPHAPASFPFLLVPLPPGCYCFSNTCHLPDFALQMCLLLLAPLFRTCLTRAGQIISFHSSDTYSTAHIPKRMRMQWQHLIHNWPQLQFLVLPPPLPPAPGLSKAFLWQEVSSNGNPLAYSVIPLTILSSLEQHPQQTRTAGAGLDFSHMPPAPTTVPENSRLSRGTWSSSE